MFLDKTYHLLNVSLVVGGSIRAADVDAVKCNEGCRIAQCFHLYLEFVREQRSLLQAIKIRNTICQNNDFTI